MQTIQELAMSVATEMTAAGYTPNTTWELYIYALLPVYVMGFPLLPLA